MKCFSKSVSQLLKERKLGSLQMCQQVTFLLSGSGDSDSPAGSVPPSWVMYHSGMQRILQCGFL